MNPILLPPEDTKTVKYENNPAHQNQERGTERKYEEQTGKTKRMTPGSKLCPQEDFHSKAQVRKNLEHEREIQHVPAKRTQHKKGKSMNLEELESSEKSERVPHAVQIDNVRDKGKVTINMNFINEFRSRNSSSEMKEYLHSKRYTGSKKHPKDSPLVFKKKKAKSNYDGQLKQVKKEIKHILEASLKKKEKTNAKSHPKVNKLPTSANSARLLKNSNKNNELSMELKSKSTQRERLSSRNGNDFKNISYTLPITAKMASLYSNTTSVFNSTEQLQRVDHHSYVIPTEESVDEIPEIRKFESLASKKKTSESLKNIKKLRLVQALEEEDAKTEPTTQNIISKYLEMLKHSQHSSHQIFSQQYSQVDQPPYPNRRGRIQQKQENQPEPLYQGIIQYSDSSEPKFQISSLLPYETEDVKIQSKEIGKLNEIIQMIGSQELNRKLNSDEKTTAIMERIKQLIGQPINSTELNRDIKLAESVQIKAKEQSNEQLSSIGSQDSAENALNLQMLDRALRERHSYLIQKRDSELSRLQEIEDEEEFQVEREKIVKWMNSQIKEVVQTRNQLWKGFNLAKNLLQEDHAGKSESSAKKREMMRCLSDKYLSRTHSKHKKDKSKEKEERLQQGRITKLEEKGKQQPSSVVRPEVYTNAPNQFIDSESENSLPEIQEQNLLNSCVVIDLQLIKSEVQRKQEPKDKQPKPKQQKSEPHQQQKELFQATNLSTLKPIDSTPVSESSSGLNLQKIVYEIECQDSYSQEELEQLQNNNKQVQPESIESTYKLTEQDKEDIYEFIFLDLCIELTEEYSIDSPLMRKIFAFTKKVKDQSKKQKGFKTNTTAIKDYLFQLISYIKGQPKLLDQVHCNIDKPLGPTALDILKYMHVYEEEPEEESEQTVFIMDISIFEQFEKVFLQNLEFQKYYEDEEKEKKRKMFLKNAIHIHNKSIFDALNESLDKQRPYGVWGEPFSWKKTAKFFHPRDKATKNNIILKCAQKAVECGAFVCGFMVDKEDCNFKDNPNVTQTYIESIRDDRLSRMLANDLEQSEQKMLFIDDEQTEILVQVANSILQTLFFESIRQIRSMF